MKLNSYTNYNKTKKEPIENTREVILLKKRAKLSRKGVLNVKKVAKSFGLKNIPVGIYRALVLFV